MKSNFARYVRDRTTAGGIERGRKKSGGDWIFLSSEREKGEEGGKKFFISSLPRR